MDEARGSGDGGAAAEHPADPGPAAAARARRAPSRSGAPRPHRGRRGFLTGVLLMAGSFLVYPAYPVLAIWPVGGRARVEVTLVAAALSWAVFSVGLYLAGRRGWVWLRRRVKGHAPRPGPPPASTP